VTILIVFLLARKKLVLPTEILLISISILVSPILTHDPYSYLNFKKNELDKKFVKILFFVIRCGVRHFQFVVNVIECYF
jgi:hypothetical protein